MSETLPKTLTLDGHTVELSSLDKVYFPQSGLTKGDLIAYYLKIADTMLPYLRGRPLTLHRFPDGIGKDGFFQQNISPYFPAWIARVTVEKEEGGDVTHAICDDAATLVYLAQQGVITPHVWLSTVEDLRRPDRLIFDLDPADNTEDYGPVRQAARIVGEALRALGLTPFVMTTGSNGFHVTAPLVREDDFDTVRALAQELAGLLAAQHPDLLTDEQRIAQRQGRIYLDTLRNSYAHTAVPPYAVRAKPGAPAATPLDWDELDSAMTPRRYTIENLFRRLAQKPDPWRDMLAHAASLAGARERLDALRGEHKS